MNLTQLLAFLLTNAGNVVNFFANLFPSVQSIITNVWTWISQAREQAVATSISNTINSIANYNVVIRSFVNFGDNLLHGRIDQAYVDLAVLFQQGLGVAESYLVNLVNRVDGEAKQRASALLNVVSGLRTELTVALHNLGVNLSNRLDTIELEFNQIIHSVGLTLAEKRELLRLLLDDPLGFIASVFFEIAIPILLYEMARALSEATVDIGQPPSFSGVSLPSSSSLPNTPSDVGVVTPPVNHTVIGGYAFAGIAHPGVDLEAYAGKKVKAAHDGFVAMVKDDDFLFGHCIRLEGTPFGSFYGHLDKMFVQPGDYVNEGDTIGTAGETGQATGIHLHFELYLYGKPVNPFRYFRVP